MDSFPLGRSDIFLDIVDYDQKKSGLAGNNVQFIVWLDGSPGRKRFENILAQSPSACLSSICLESRFLKGRCWMMKEARAGKMRPFFSYHHVKDEDQYDLLLDEIVNRPIDLSTPPVFRLDLVESSVRRACLCLTWHHLLTDARGGEMLFRSLSGVHVQGVQASCPSVPGDAVSRGLLQSLEQARQFKPMVRRMKECGVKSPAAAVSVDNVHLESIYTVLSVEESGTFSRRARDVHPLFGETAMMMAACLKAVHELIPHEQRHGGYVVPVPLSNRHVQEALSASWQPGNRVSICFIPVSMEQVEGLDVHALAGLVAAEFREQITSGLPEAAEAAMDVARLFPRGMYRWIMRDSMDGQLCSFYFSNTGPVTVGGPEGQAFSIAGRRVRACFHRPMVSHPPGAGFFFSTYDCRLHFTTCFVPGAVSRHSAKKAAQRIRSILAE